MATAKPVIASAEEWRRARDELLVGEKEATRALDVLAARRRRLPMVSFPTKYEFASTTGKKSLLDLFDGRDQLMVYQFMDMGPEAFCAGCTGFTDNIAPASLAALADRGVSWATVSDMPLSQMAAYWTKMGWVVPFVSSRGTSFSVDCGANWRGFAAAPGSGFMLTAFFWDGDEVYRTYNTTARGTDRLVFSRNILDLTVFGRQEDWEDSPPGWPQRPTYG
jgi:predicted dithiol-disulfide oxidoreductase (DUF899 family)